MFLVFLIIFLCLRPPKNHILRTLRLQGRVLSGDKKPPQEYPVSYI